MQKCTVYGFKDMHQTQKFKVAKLPDQIFYTKQDCINWAEEFLKKEMPGYEVNPKAEMDSLDHGYWIIKVFRSDYENSPILEFHVIESHTEES